MTDHSEPTIEVASIPGGQATLHYAVDQLIELELENPELIAAVRLRRGREAGLEIGDEA